MKAEVPAPLRQTGSGWGGSVGGDGDFTALRGRLMKSCCCSPLSLEKPPVLIHLLPLVLRQQRGWWASRRCWGLPLLLLAKQSPVLRPYPCQGLAPRLQSSVAKKMLFREKKYR